MEIPPDLELAIAAQIDAERQLELAKKYVTNSRELVIREAAKSNVSGINLFFMIGQMRNDPSAKQVHNLTNPE